MSDGDPSLPDDVKSAVARLSPSLHALEVLLLLHREQGRSFTAADVARELGLADRIADLELARLRSLGVAAADATVPGATRFDGTTSERAAIEEIARAYATRRVALVNHVASSALSRMRDFANAFRLRRGKRDE